MFHLAQLAARVMAVMTKENSLACLHCSPHVTHWLKAAVIQAGQQSLAGGSLLHSGQTQVSEPKIGEHAQ
jgi:hypothetical protein